MTWNTIVILEKMKGAFFMSMKITMTDMDIVWEDKEANKKQCVAMVEEAAEQKA